MVVNIFIWNENVKFVIMNNDGFIVLDIVEMLKDNVYIF